MVFTVFFYVASAFVVVVAGPEVLLMYAAVIFLMGFTDWLRTGYWPAAETVGHYFQIGVSWEWVIPARTVDWFLEFSTMSFFVVAGLVGLFFQVWFFKAIGAAIDERSARQRAAR
jgi:hypothetical protein